VDDFGFSGSAFSAFLHAECDLVHYVAPVVGFAFLFGQSLHGSHPRCSPLGWAGFKLYYSAVVGGVF